MAQIQMFEEPGEGEPDPLAVSLLASHTRSNINVLALDVMTQADQLFPNRTDASMFLKIYGETAEVIGSNGSADEVADIFIMWLDYAARKGIDIETAVRLKMGINSKRTWLMNEVGVFQHI